MRKHSNVSVDTRLIRTPKAPHGWEHHDAPSQPFSRKDDSSIYTPDTIPWADPSDVVLLTTTQPTHDWRVSADMLRRMDSETLSLCDADTLATLFKV